MGAFFKEDYRKSNKFLQKLLSFVLAKYGEMKRLVVTIDNMSIQERHIFQTSRPSLYSEPPSFLLKSEFIKTCTMTRYNTLCCNFFFFKKKIVKK